MKIAMPVSARLRFSVATYIVLVIGLVFSLRMVWNSLTAPGWETPAVILALGLLLSYDVCRKIYRRPTGPRGVEDSAAAWALLILFFLLAILPLPFVSAEWRMCLCLWLFLLAPLRFSSGRRVAAFGSIPLFVFCVFLPMHSEIMLAISHPLRVIATVVAGTILRLFGYDVTNSLTVLRLGSVDLAITDACSGIQQFEALLLLGYILAKHQQKGLKWWIVHYAFSIPAVIFANAVRLVLVVMLYFGPVGEEALYSKWHEGLGYIQVLLALLFMWLFGNLIAYANDSSQEASK